MPTDSLQNQLQSALGVTYTVERELGGGGMSRVFLALDTRLERAYQERSHSMAFLDVDAGLDPLRNDLRFTQLLARTRQP